MEQIPIEWTLYAMMVLAFTVIPLAWKCLLPLRKRRPRVEVGIGVGAWAVFFGVFWPASIPYALWKGMGRIVRMMEVSSARKLSYRWTVLLFCICWASIFIVVWVIKP